MFEFSQAFKERYGGCFVGGIEVEFETPPSFTQALEKEISRRETAVSERYASSSRARLKALPVISEYVSHFKRFKKSYHVLLQLASAAEGKPVGRFSPLVSIMLATELSNFVLSSGHDLDRVGLPFTFDIGDSRRAIDLLGDRSQTLKDGDITLRDESGETTLAAVVYGQSRHGMITEQTTHALYVAYGVPGVDGVTIEAYLGDVAEMLALCDGSPRVGSPQVVEVAAAR